MAKGLPALSALACPICGSLSGGTSWEHAGIAISRLTGPEVAILRLMADGGNITVRRVIPVALTYVRDSFPLLTTHALEMFVAIPTDDQGDALILAEFMQTGGS